MDVRIRVQRRSLYLRFLGWLDKYIGTTQVAYQWGETVYFVKSRLWEHYDLDDYATFLKVLEHETIHVVLHRLRLWKSNDRFDDLFNLDIPLRLVPEDVFMP